MSSFTRVVAPASEVLSLSSELVSLSLYFFSGHTSFLSHRNVADTLAIIENIIGTSDKLSDNSGRVTSSMRNVFALWQFSSCETLHCISVYKQLGCEGDQIPFFGLRRDESEATYRISINKQLREVTQLEPPSCGTTLQCIMLSNLMWLKRTNLPLRSTTAEM
jgi:hypothetical protein